jgi:glycine hydroxymethyltransferase
MPGVQGGPLMHIIAAKAVAFQEALQPSFKTYQEQVIRNAQVMAQAFQNLGYRIVSGGTNTHLFLIDLRNKPFGSTILTGKQVEELLMQCNIILNRNMIPFDTQSPTITSGIRIGTPALTTRGFKENDVIQVAHWINEAITRRDDQQFIHALKDNVISMCKQFPIYKDNPTNIGSDYLNQHCKQILP